MTDKMTQNEIKIRVAELTKQSATLYTLLENFEDHRMRRELRATNSLLRKYKARLDA